MSSLKSESLRQPFINLVAVVCVVIALLTGAVDTRAQEGTQPKRGFHPAGSYALGDLETISTTNGNLMLHIPMASLPAGRDGVHGV